MRARHFFLWIAIAAVVSFAAQRWGRFDAPTQRAPAETGTPITGRAKIIDGNSLEVAGERIRLFGIDAPEGRQQCRDAKGEDYACGRDAARILTALIGGRPVSCTLVTHDQYARDVATCEAKDTISARRWCAPATRATMRATARGATRRPSVTPAQPGAGSGWRVRGAGGVAQAGDEVGRRGPAVTPPRLVQRANDAHTSSKSADSRRQPDCPTSSSPCASHAQTAPRTDRGYSASIIGYCSSGLRECSRLRVASKFTWRRPGASVRAFLPRTPNRITSVTLRK